MFNSKNQKKIKWIYSILAVLMALGMIAFLLIPLLNA